MPNKILLVGCDVLDFMVSVCNAAIEDGFQVTVKELRAKGLGLNNVLNKDVKVLQTSVEKNNSAEILYALFSYQFYSYFYSNIALLFITNTNILKAFKYLLINSFYSFLLHKKNKVLFKEADIVNFHQIWWGGIHLYLSLVTDKQKLVVSFWGSDLYRCSDLSILYHQKKIIQRADIITVHSVEMREVLLAKFGRDIYPKVRLTLLTAGSDILSGISEKEKDTEREGFCAKYNINSGKNICAIGYNASIGNNHIPVLEQLKNSRHKKDLLIFLQMGYGADAVYKNQVIAFLEEHNFDYIIEHKFLSVQEVIQLRMSVDLFFMLPQSDAFSLSLAETIYASAYVIVGAWLPYSRYRVVGVLYKEVGDFREINNSLDDYMLHKCDIKNQLLSNKEKVRRILSEKLILNTWVDIYKNLKS